jgi:hypothetical protein
LRSGKSGVPSNFTISSFTIRRMRSEAIHFVDAVAELAVEAVGIEQRQEKLEVLFLAVVRRGGHQQQVPRVPGRFSRRS